MKNHSKPMRHKGFTLIELLVVITIIIVLVGMLYAGVGAAMRAAKNHQAQTTVTALATAFRAYYQEYGTWPVANENEQSLDTPMCQMLMGSNLLGNTRSIRFLESVTNSMPWTPNVGAAPKSGNYYFKFDANGDNQLLLPPPAAMAAVSAQVGVYTQNPDTKAYITSY